MDPRRKQEQGGATQQKPPIRRSRRINKNKPRFSNPNPNYRRRNSHHNQRTVNRGRIYNAGLVEQMVVTALDQMRQVVAHGKPLAKDEQIQFYPTVRDCNAALATFADSGDFLRALSLFLKMRKAASLATMTSSSSQRNAYHYNAPAPTLVTYCTLMSRAVKVGKASVALRLWHLMRTQANFFSSNTPIQAAAQSRGHRPAGNIILPDVKACNILMNVYAKLANAEAAQNLMDQMKYGNGTDVPRLRPNIVTYNTLLDACHKAGELDAALQAKAQLDQELNIFPDARTYTSLIATVGGRKSSVAVSGANDPRLAFELLDEMLSRDIRPNGMTYSALIDACSRCGKTDMALSGLRAMLRQKKVEKRARKTMNDDGDDSLCNEVGAWTAAINAMGKAGRIETAVRLFRTMYRAGIMPNTVTCGCLADRLLKHGRTAETLELLDFMKQHRIVPSEIMYTSLMSSAGKLVEMENKQQQNHSSGRYNEDDDGDDDWSSGAIQVYTALMQTLMQRNKKKFQKWGSKNKKEKQREDTSSELIMKVFLVFQEMKTTGATPDIASYNVLLRACSFGGDVERGMDVLAKIKADGLVPNDRTWRELLRSAATARQSRVAKSIWTHAMEYRGVDKVLVKWKPSADSFATLVSAYLRDAHHSDNEKKQISLYKEVVTFYKDVLTGSEKRKIDKKDLQENARAMGLVLQAIVALESKITTERHQLVLRKLAIAIVDMEGLWKERRRPNHTWRCIDIARVWKNG